MDLDDNLSQCAGLNKSMRRANVRGRKSPLVKKRFQLAASTSALPAQGSGHDQNLIRLERRTRNLDLPKLSAGPFNHPDCLPINPLRCSPRIPACQRCPVPIVECATEPIPQ